MCRNRLIFQINSVKNARDRTVCPVCSHLGVGREEEVFYVY